MPDWIISINSLRFPAVRNGNVDEFGLDDAISIIVCFEWENGKATK